MSAFALASDKLNRTPAACGFRWNAFLRKQLIDEVKEAKKQRMKHSEKEELDIIHHIIEQLKQLKNADREISRVQAYDDLHEENIALRNKISHYEESWAKMHDIWAKTYSLLEQKEI